MGVVCTRYDGNGANLGDTGGPGIPCQRFGVYRPRWSVRDNVPDINQVLTSPQFDRGAWVDGNGHDQLAILHLIAN